MTKWLSCIIMKQLQRPLWVKICTDLLFCAYNETFWQFPNMFSLIKSDNTFLSRPDTYLPIRDIDPEEVSQLSLHKVADNLQWGYQHWCTAPSTVTHRRTRWSHPMVELDQLLLLNHIGDWWWRHHSNRHGQLHSSNGHLFHTEKNSSLKSNIYVMKNQRWWLICQKWS